MIEAMNIPKLRFPEFIGEWKEKRLGDIGDFKGGGTPSKSVKEYWHGDIPWISSSDINEQDIHNIKISKFINEVAIKESATKIIPKESVLFISRVGVGKLAINTKEVCTSQDFTSLLPKNTSSYFLGYFFLAKNNLLIRYSQGTSIKGFTKKDIEALRLNIPTEPEQQKIATFLTEVDNKIEQLSKKQELLGEYKKGLMQQIFSQTIRFKADDGSIFPDWEEKKLGDVVDNVGGTALEKHTTSNSKYKFISIGNYGINGEYIDNGQRVEFNDKTKAKLLAKDNLVMVLNDKTAVGDIIGSSILIDSNDSYIYNQRSERLICKSELLPIFAWHYLNSKMFRKSVFSISQGGTQIYVNFPSVKDLKFSLPIFSEQIKIANVLSSINNKIEQVVKQLDESKQFKKALLQQMFV